MDCPLFYEGRCLVRESICSPGDEICVVAIQAYCSGQCEEMRKTMAYYRIERDATISRARCERARIEYEASEKARAAKDKNGT